MSLILTKNGKIFDDSDAARERRFEFIVDVGGDISSVTGFCGNILGYARADLRQRNIAAIVHPDSIILLSEIAYNAALLQPMEQMVLFLNGANRVVAGCTVTGEPIPRDDENYLLKFEWDPELELKSRPRNSAKGLVDDVQRLMARHGDKDLDLTFVDVGDVDNAVKTLGLSQDDADGFRRQVEERLKRDSVDGKTVNRVDSGKYGVVAERGLNVDALTGDLQKAASRLDPKGIALTVDTSAVSLDADGMSEDDIANAVGHAVDEFVDAGLDAIIFDTLTESQAAWVDKRADRTEMLREAIENDWLSVVFRPTLEPKEWVAEHLLAEFRADLEEDGLGVDEIISLTSDKPELRCAVDLAQCRYIVDSDGLESFGVAIKLSIRSLLEPGMMQGLVEFAQYYPDRRVILRLEGLTPDQIGRIRAIQVLRDAGFRIALIGKEIGAVSEEMLRTLPADYIILDASFAVDAENLKRTLPALGGMAARCAEHGIMTIFEGVVDFESVRLLTPVPGTLVMGDYLGQPVEDPNRLALPARQ